VSTKRNSYQLKISSNKKVTSQFAGCRTSPTNIFSIVTYYLILKLIYLFDNNFKFSSQREDKF